ncbi:MAG TPA: hypothetical protein VK157_01310 [Phycisphaerales bacterium]|nr:hypothetical protein [Phycisphaerales bacterium]
MRMSFTRSLSARTLAAMMTIAAAGTHATGVQDQQEQVQDEQQAASMLPELRFAGGTIEQFVKALKDASRVPFNVVVHPSAAGAAIPPISIDNSEPMQAILAIEGLTFERDAAMYSLDVRMAHSPYEGVSSIQATRVMSAMPATAINTTTDVFDLSSIVKPADASGNGLTLDDVLAAVTIAVEQANSSAMPPISPMVVQPSEQLVAKAKLSLHRETNLLIVTGTTDQIRAAGQVVTRLQQRRQGWTTLTDVSIAATGEEKAWLLSQLTVAARYTEGMTIREPKEDASTVVVSVPADLSQGAALLGRYLLSPEVRADRTQRMLEAAVVQTRLETRAEALEREIARAQAMLAEREAKMREENDRLRDVIAKLEGRK